MRDAVQIFTYSNMVVAFQWQKRKGFPLAYLQCIRSGETVLILQNECCVKLETERQRERERERKRERERERELNPVSNLSNLTT